MNFALRIPDYYRKDIEALKGNVSINQFVVTAIAEKIASLKTLDELQKRATRGSGEHGLAMLGKVADVERLYFDQAADLGAQHLGDAIKILESKSSDKGVED